MLYTNIINHKEELNNYLEVLSLPTSKPQKEHLTALISGIIEYEGRKTLTRITDSVHFNKDRSTTSRFLNSSPWNENEVNLLRKNYILHLLDLCKDEKVYIFIDDTLCTKSKETKNIEGLYYNHSHTEHKSVWSHVTVNIHLQFGEYSIPYDFELYTNEALNPAEYKSKITIARELVNSLPGLTNREVYVLTDSWYTCKDLCKEVIQKGFKYIGAVKKNRIIYNKDQKIKLSTYTEFITTPPSLVTVGDKQYSVHRLEGYLQGRVEGVTLISTDIENKTTAYIFSTDKTLSDSEIIEIYSKRWNIEVSYRYFKENLGYDQCQMRSKLSIKRYWIVQYLAFNYLETLRVQLCLETIGETISMVKSSNYKREVEFIYNSGRNGASLEDVYCRLGIVA